MKRANKDAVLRARTETDLKREVEWAAGIERLDEADIIRKACAEYVNRLKTRIMSPPNQMLTHV